MGGLLWCDGVFPPVGPVVAVLIVVGGDLLASVAADLLRSVPPPGEPVRLSTPDGRWAEATVAGSLSMGGPRRAVFLRVDRASPGLAEGPDRGMPN